MVKTAVAAVKPVRRFSIRKVVIRQIVKADFNEDKSKLLKEYDFISHGQTSQTA